ncbi:Poly (ADP-ribose) polymerase-like [Hyalella azteca]|uniref:Poly [ADP-ribose] polymerase n=1 Tax=Hyalella azteca TaxID=294128 RepID=A0A6A0H9N0_HYAAZ|nr:protein mono-ADP-ribosyltransferase PARP12-like [Hyalella azteca]KAA0202470.1 Poly (ADP-ribose) polymerase-like [Hyalella azteca]
MRQAGVQGAGLLRQAGAPGAGLLEEAGAPRAELLGQVEYEWYFKEDDGSWLKFGSRGNPNIIGTLERQYLSNPSTNFKFTIGSQSYVINFTNITQTNTSTGKVREVRRLKQHASTTGGALGSSSTSASTKLFTEIPFGQTSYATPLEANHADYTYVLYLLRSTNCQPRNIFKVNNPYLKAAFYIKKAQLQSQYPGVPYREECLFHGTKTANVKAILEENIDWRLHGSNVGQVHGRGAYFSNNAQLSRRYGQVIFICKVLVGLTAPGNRKTVKPPKDGSNRPIDTTVNHQANPTIFVKYDSQEYYPEYYAVC